jgi:lipopolysaccharide biosynthesis protein
MIGVIRRCLQRLSRKQSSDKAPSAASPRVIAFYLPQFHPIPENNAWWGKGFTEWTNVTRAKSLFRGHQQPHLPTDLGYYDLRLPESRAAQSDLAREYGVDGFCYWHYWFGGKRLLQRPFNEVLRSGEPDFPICLAWANEPWSRTWLGREQDVMMPQMYSEDDDHEHAKWLVQAFADRRYIRSKDRPVFLIYAPKHHPNIKRFVATLREAASKNRVPDPYLIGINSHSHEDFRPFGFDENLKFEPQLGALPLALQDDTATDIRKAANKALGIDHCDLRLFDYAESRRKMQQHPTPSPSIPCVMVGFDSSPRRGAEGIIIINNSPEAFEQALSEALADNQRNMPGNDLIFVNAWNEWAEGNHLEPDLAHGLRYLEAVRKAKSAF